MQTSSDPLIASKRISTTLGSRIPSFYRKGPGSGSRPATSADPTCPGHPGPDDGLRVVSAARAVEMVAVALFGIPPIGREGRCLLPLRGLKKPGDVPICIFD